MQGVPRNPFPVAYLERWGDLAGLPTARPEVRGNDAYAALPAKQGRALPSARAERNAAVANVAGKNGRWADRPGKNPGRRKRLAAEPFFLRNFLVSR